MANNTVQLSQPLKQFPYRLLILVGDAILSIAIVGMVACAVMAYWMEAHLSIATLVVVHIGIMVMAALVKLGYVLRLAACYEIDNQAQRAANKSQLNGAIDS